MAQLAIPQSLIGALIDIADLGTLDYFPPTERCAHWSLYDAQRPRKSFLILPARNSLPPYVAAMRKPATLSLLKRNRTTCRQPKLPKPPRLRLPLQRPTRV